MGLWPHIKGPSIKDFHNEGEGIGKKAHYITHEVWDWDTGKGEGDHKLLKRAMFQPDLGR